MRKYRVLGPTADIDSISLFFSNTAAAKVPVAELSFVEYFTSELKTVASQFDLFWSLFTSAISTLKAIPFNAMCPLPLEVAAFFDHEEQASTPRNRHPMDTFRQNIYTTGFSETYDMFFFKGSRSFSLAPKVEAVQVNQRILKLAAAFTCFRSERCLSAFEHHKRGGVDLQPDVSTRALREGVRASGQRKLAALIQFGNTCKESHLIFETLAEMIKYLSGVSKSYRCKDVPAQKLVTPEELLSFSPDPLKKNLLNDLEKQGVDQTKLLEVALRLSEHLPFKTPKVPDTLADDLKKELTELALEVRDQGPVDVDGLLNRYVPEYLKTNAKKGRKQQLDSAYTAWKASKKELIRQFLQDMKENQHFSNALAALQGAVDQLAIAYASTRTFLQHMFPNPENQDIAHVTADPTSAPIYKKVVCGKER
eukprot:gnl/Spiro4/25406_TR12670_c0_g1_i1.p1 gnl/Spiro4/25406_TR12670_c0_g1~~gnl/Spiro4/25406_TR12670_c0_g1_i1.p1  ORF type:complete len:480 (-),score=147.96 gnl/Spiro4/25406_TR12670_c0_g1_i1:98-1366(-)